MTDSLATRLREDTQHSHTLAENTAFMKCFLKGMIQPLPFCQFLCDLYFIYSALEEAMRRYYQDFAVETIYFPQLERTPHLEKDLAFYYGDNWKNKIKASPAGSHYAARICEVANSEPALLVAHAYVRYMGDLSGGQALKRIVRSALDLPEGQGADFYDFADLPTVDAQRAFKTRYREALNTIPCDETLIQKIVDEANLAFSLNRDVVHGLESLVREELGDHTFEEITRQDRPGSTEHRHRSNVEPLATKE